MIKIKSFSSFHITEFTRCKGKPLFSPMQIYAILFLFHVVSTLTKSRNHYKQKKCYKKFFRTCLVRFVCRTDFLNGRFVFVFRRFMGCRWSEKCGYSLFGFHRFSSASFKFVQLHSGIWQQGNMVVILLSETRKEVATLGSSKLKFLFNSNFIVLWLSSM